MLAPANITILHKLLICTTQVPFYGCYGNVCKQTDNVAMGSPLGPTLSNFYMAHVENKVFNNFAKSMIYAISMTFIIVKNIPEIMKPSKKTWYTL